MQTSKKKKNLLINIKKLIFQKKFELHSMKFLILENKNVISHYALFITNTQFPEKKSNFSHNFTHFWVEDGETKDNKIK